MAEFVVAGPFRIKCDKLANGRVANPVGFWSSHKSLKTLAERRGVYIFAIKPSRTGVHTPYYVGKATKSFRQEVFTERNQLKYNRCLANFKRGRPVVFLLVHPKTRGATNAKQIAEIEAYLIGLGYIVNPDIENDRGISQPEWAISGVVRGRARRPSGSAKQFAATFGLTKK